MKLLSISEERKIIKITKSVEYPVDSSSLEYLEDQEIVEREYIFEVTELSFERRRLEFPFGDCKIIYKSNLDSKGISISVWGDSGFRLKMECSYLSLTPRHSSSISDRLILNYTYDKSKKSQTYTSVLNALDEFAYKSECLISKHSLAEKLMR